MALAQTDRTAAAGIGATVTFYNANRFGGPLNYTTGPMALVTGPGGSCHYTFEKDGIVTPIKLNLHARAVAGITEEEDDLQHGHWDYIPGTPGQWEWTQDAAATAIASVTIDALILYYERVLGSELAGLENGPTSACHPLHNSHRYAWGARNASKVAASGVGAAIDTETGYNLDPVWAPDGGGTTDLGQFTVGVGCDSRPQFEDVQGKVTEITGLGCLFGGVNVAAAMPSGRYPAEGSEDGCHCEWDGDSISFWIDDYDAVPVDGKQFGLTLYAPVILDTWARGREWNLVGEYGSFDVPDPDTAQGTKPVSSGFQDLLVFWRYTLPGGSIFGWRPFQAQSDVNAAWAAANHEDPSPPARRVVLEGHGLDLPSFAGNEAPALWAATDILKILLAPEINVFNPDGLETPPAEWSADDEELSLGRVGDVVTVTVDELASDAAIRLDMLDVWYLFNTTAAGIEALGFPWCYMFQKHTSGYHICNWDNRKFVRIDYDSDEAATLALEITHRRPTVTEPHVTGQARVDGFEIADDPEIIVLPFSVVAGVGQHVYVDLDIPAGRKLDHVSKVRITGFDGAEADWDFSFTGPHLRAYNPKTTAEVGRTMALFTYNRLNPATDKPICGTGWRFDTDGGRCCRPPDQYVQLCGEEGIDFWEWLHGAETGTCLCHGATLAEGIQVLHHQELWSVEHADDETPPWDPDNAIYQEHFVDDESGTYGGPNDCLGGVLYMWDARNNYDLLLDEDGLAYVHMDVRPCGGVVYPASGVRIPFAWLHHFQGSMHGMVDDGDGKRDLTNAEVNLYEHDGESASIVATENASDWGDYQFRGEAGAREVYEEGVAVTGQTPSQWYGPINTLRWWAGAEVVLAEKQPDMCRDHAGIVHRVYVRGSGLAYDRLESRPFGFEARVTGLAVGDSPDMPTITRLQDGTLLIAYRDSDTGATAILKSTNYGKNWTAL